MRKTAQLVFLLLTPAILMIWGWGDLSGFFSHPARVGLCVVLVLSVLCLWSVPFDLFAAGKKDIRRQRWATFLALGVVGGLSWFLPYADRRELFVWPEGNGVRYAGLACVAGGMGIRIAGMMQLGRLFSGFVAVQKDHQLITEGCFHWVRHPIYTGSLVALVGLFLVFRSQLVVIAVPCYVIGTIWRIHDEEQLLAEVFGRAYEEYRTRTWRLLPFVY